MDHLPLKQWLANSMKMPQDKKSIIVFITLLIIIGIGAWLRMSGIFANSFAFTYDVGRDLLKLREIVIDHNLTLIGPTTGLGGLFYGPWWYYILVLPFIVSSGNPQSIALFIALLGIITVIVGYFIGKRVDGNCLGLMIASLLSFSPVMVGLSSQIWNPNIAPFFVTLSIFILLKLHDAKSKIPYLFLLGILTGILLDAEIIFGLLFLAGIILSLFLLFRKKIIQFSSLLFFVGFLITLLPRVIFEIKHDFIMIRTIFTERGIQEETIRQGSNTSLQTLDFLLSFIANILTDGNKVLGVVILLVLCILLIYSYSKFSKQKKIFLQIILSILLVFIIGVIFFPFTLYEHYLVGLPVILIFLSGLLLVTKPHRFSWLLNGIIVSLVIINVQPLRIYSSLTQPQWEGDAAVYRNQVAVLDYIYEDAGGRPFNYIVYTPPVHDYTYQYLFKWYGIRQYKYIPSVDHVNLFYVIIEPDSQGHRIQEWLKIRENDGEVINQKTVKGEIIVQTRIRP